MRYLDAEGPSPRGRGSQLRGAARHLLTPARAAPYAVLPEHWDAVRVFAAAQTQWRYAGLGGVPTGLDYAGCRAAAAGLGVRWRAVFDAVRVMELEWLSAQAGQREDP